MNTENRSLIIGSVVAIIVLVGLVWIARTHSPALVVPAAVTTTDTTTQTAETPTFQEQPVAAPVVTNPSFPKTGFKPVQR